MSARNCGRTRAQLPPEKRVPACLYVSETNLGSDYDADDVEFMLAVQSWQKRHKVRYPAMTDYLEIAKTLGYRKVLDSRP